MRSMKEKCVEMKTLSKSCKNDKSDNMQAVLRRSETHSPGKLGPRIPGILQSATQQFGTLTLIVGKYDKLCLGQIETPAETCDQRPN